MMALIKEIKFTNWINIRYIQCDNTIENEAFNRLCKQEGMGIKFSPCQVCCNKMVALSIHLKYLK